MEGLPTTTTPVYPRVGGGTKYRTRRARSENGLSPRGRGNHDIRRRACADQRSIPAWAGEPTAHAPPTISVTVYPRVGGGTCFSLRKPSIAAGLSPRGRGNHLHRPREVKAPRSIPAWAGEPSALCRQRPTSSGLSPRGRGNLALASVHLPMLWSIPAWAGEPELALPGYHRDKVYPRVGGGTIPGQTYEGQLYGLSPRGRGNPKAGEGECDAPRSIPAWAGEPATYGETRSWTQVYPRVGGGT